LFLILFVYIAQETRYSHSMIQSVNLADLMNQSQYDYDTWWHQNFSATVICHVL